MASSSRLAHHHNVHSAASTSSHSTDPHSSIYPSTSQSDTILVATRLSQVNLNEREERQQALDRLEILKTVGTGSYGRVLVVRDRETSKFYALKVFSITHIVQSRQTEHVKCEKEILSALKHPFIVHLYWTHHSDQFLYMLLDYMPGGELFSYMRKKGTFDLKTSLFYTCELILAFEYLHSLQIVYRDLKPENILLDGEGHIKLVDFGEIRLTNENKNISFRFCKENSQQYVYNLWNTGLSQSRIIQRNWSQ